MANHERTRWKPSCTTFATSVGMEAPKFLVPPCLNDGNSTVRFHCLNLWKDTRDPSCTKRSESVIKLVRNALCKLDAATDEGRSSFAGRSEYVASLWLFAASFVVWRKKSVTHSVLNVGHCKKAPKPCRI